MTTAELVTLVKDRSGIDSSASVSDAQILAFLNERQKELCSNTDVLVSCWTASTVLNQQQYSVPSEYTSVEAIRLYQTTNANAKYWLKKVQIDDIDASKRTGTPDRFALWGLNVSGNNSPAFWLDPIPNVNGSSDLECYGRQLPATMVSGGQAPEVREDAQYAIVQGALALVYMRLAAGDPAWLPLADRAAAMWTNAREAIAGESFMDITQGLMGRDTMGYTR